MARNVFYIPVRNDELQKNVAIYCRVSSSSREQLQSLSAQVSALTRAVSNVSQWRLADVFIDIGSAKGGAQRQEFNRMIAECENHNLSVILTKSISRFGRDTVETLDAIKRIKAAGAQIIFDEEHVDTDELDSDLMISIIEAVAQAENESRSENIRIGLERRTALGVSGHMRRKLYGYKKNPSGELEVDEEQAKVVRDVFRWYLDGESTLV